VSLSQKLSRVPLTDRSVLQGIVGTIEFSLRLLDSVHIGSGELSLIVKSQSDVKRLAQDILAKKSIERAGAKAVDLTSIGLRFVRLGNRLCVLGSTLKGVIRARLELMAGKRGSEVTASACLTFAGPPPTKPPAPGSQGWRHVKIWGSAASVNREAESYLEEESISELCPVCNLLGAPGAVSRVLFGNACCDNCSTQLCTISEYGMMLEVLPLGTVLRGSVTLRGVAVEELGLLLIGMGFDGMNFKPVLLGRLKYAGKGMGRAVFSLEKLVVAPYSVSYLSELGVSAKQSGNGYIVEGGELGKLIGIAFAKARKRYPDVEPFSEAEEKEGISQELNLVRCS
jgi:CRISPR/Cas system CSM-associated protein Csm3 (group 7 of RAMP superfamily)